MEISLSDEPIMHSRILSDQPVSISAPPETGPTPDSPPYLPTLAPTPTPDSPPYTPGDEWPPPTPYSPRSSSSNALVIGGSIGGVLVLLLASFIGFYVWKMKKNSRPQGISMQHGESPSTPKMVEEDLYIGSYRQQQPSPPPVDHVVKLSSDPNSIPIPPPPLPGNLNSSGSVSESSGSEPLPRPSHGIVFGISISTFTYEELIIATDGFSDANVLGEGGFGYVHKGVLSNGKEVAVKQLKSDSRQGEREFRAEVDIISRVHHKHLVSLVGYCISDGQRLLVYEFVSNSTLESHLHGKNRPTMEWSTRLKLALGSAKGLAYLHEDCHPKIIHRDIKAANILIDYNFEAKVADFGLAKFSEDNKTHVSTRIMGTFGYLAPEYASSGKLTDKSDVFSFGVILLELITGRRPVDMTPSSAYDSLVEWARPLMARAIEDGNYETLVDPSLGKNYKQNEMAHMIVCAAACVLPSAKCRPHMSQVVRALEGDTSVEDLTKGVKLSHNKYISPYNNSDNYKTMEEFRKIAMQSSEYQSSQYSAPTGEYSLNTSGSGSEGQHKLDMEMGR